MEKREDELERLAKPLIEFLRENCHPYTAIVITDERVAVVETILSIPRQVHFVPEDSQGQHTEKMTSCSAN